MPERLSGLHSGVGQFLWAACLLLLAAGICGAQQTPQCLPCHGVERFGIQASDGRIIDLHIDARLYRASVHGDLQCYQCHVNMAIQPHALVPLDAPPAVRPFVADRRHIVRPAAASCITCHEEAYQQFVGSAHAEALLEGNRSAPFCADCHGSHYILGTEDLESEVNPENVPATCATCHAIGILMSRYDVRTDTYDTFRQSVHGRKLALGQEDVAVCTSCHGVHDIRSADDPQSLLHPGNIVETCRVCHPGASREFAFSFRHVTPSPTVEPAVYWVQLAYTWLIIILVVGMAAYVALDLYRRLLEWGRRREEERQ